MASAQIFSPSHFILFSMFSDDPADFLAPSEPDVPPGYTVCTYNNKEFIVPDFAVADLEAKMASREERATLGVSSIPSIVRLLFCPHAKYTRAVFISSLV
jgi:hypothetical protein